MHLSFVKPIRDICLFFSKLTTNNYKQHTQMPMGRIAVIILLLSVILHWGIVEAQEIEEIATITAPDVEVTTADITNTLNDLFSVTGGSKWLRKVLYKDLLYLYLFIACLAWLGNKN